MVSGPTGSKGQGTEGGENVSGKPVASWTVHGAARNLVKRFSRTHRALVWEVTIGGEEIESR